MGNNLLTYKNNSLWIHDWWISLSAYYFLQCIEEGKYDKELEPYKKEIIKRLQLDTNGFIAGALNLGTDIAIDANLVKPYINSLQMLKNKIRLQGEFINEEQCKKIDDLNFTPSINYKFKPVSTKILISKVDEIINLLEE